MVPSDSTGLNAKGEYVPNSSEDTDISIAEICEFVKAHDKDFEKDSENSVYFNPKPVSREVLNADGTPKVFYHGSDELFTTFGYDKIGSATGRRRCLKSTAAWLARWTSWECKNKKGKLH